MSDQSTAAYEADAPDINNWNARVIAEVRANAGYAAWSSEADFAAGRPVPPRIPGLYDGHPGMPLILVHHTGAKSGRARISPLFYLPVGDNWAVFATHGGSPRHPAWYRNLMSNPQITVETGTETVPAVARLTEGAERERIWAEEVALVPKFAEFETAAGRQIPVVVLERADANEVRA
ncbi:deazaflavin-dependent oxidoreductase (nitroreductase family) [Nocardia tenerifensis]|uniref:Deazaflavin-dependent oxidoreductase (Nitroreductase family) n=1 Tax=Nocardia tenerifensis TaxID=228006 RepID=A0A318JZY7_9NOCA|nr:nitroreductase/quinone reductase family protein [Nocardia tenerifensis]PXX61577.1 deazaflavin-dependent oxidoreductase (nitroreductase family) [Nocardia tenerifensis]